MSGKGIQVKETNLMLDFGCGDGHHVCKLRVMGYKHVYEHNKLDYGYYQSCSAAERG
jgi:hypothetical protein